MTATIMSKLLAAGLALITVHTQPEAPLNFNPEQDEARAIQTLREGCQIMLREFGAEKIDFDLIFGTLISNGKAMNLTLRVKDIDLGEVANAYKYFCKNDDAAGASLNIKEALSYLQDTLKNLPDPATLKDLKMKQTSLVLDVSGQRFSEHYKDDNRRLWVPLAQVPVHVQKAFVAAEDKRFYEHKGIDLRGIIRAFINNMAASNRPQGGSTITQQVIKNLLVGSDITFERKIQEIVLATRLEKILTKDQILEIYLNYIFLGRASWGVEMASRSYFGKSVQDVGVRESAMLAGLAKGPNYFNPDLYVDRFKGRVDYVLGRMKEDNYLNVDQARIATETPVPVIPFEGPQARRGFYFLNEAISSVKKILNISSLNEGSESYEIFSTLHRPLHQAAEEALSEGLAQYEIKTGKAKFSGPVRNIQEQIKKLESELADPAKNDGTLWNKALRRVRSPIYDSAWPTAVVVSKNKSNLMVGLYDGRILPLRSWSSSATQGLKLGDVVHVSPSEKTAELRFNPSVQGAVLVLENKTGRVLSMVGGYSYALNQYNRAMNMERQPGSTIKPLTYLAALQSGLQPNTLVLDSPVTLGPVVSGPGAKSWSPKNFGSSSNQWFTLRRALEQSKNLVTARLLTEIKSTPQESLDEIRAISEDLGLYQKSDRYYPFILGSQVTRLSKLAAFYATVANGGHRPQPYLIEKVHRQGQLVYQKPAQDYITSQKIDGVSFHQLKSLLQGVVEKGTAARIKDLSSVVAGKTGTSNSSKDVWFAGFTNDITIVVWLGYDKNQPMGSSATGGTYALPIFEKIVRKSFEVYKPATPLEAPHPSLAPYMVSQKIDYLSGRLLDPASSQNGSGGPKSIDEFFRLGPAGSPLDTWQKIAAGNWNNNVPREDSFADEDFDFLRAPSQGRNQDSQAEQRTERRRDPAPVEDSSERRRNQRVDSDFDWRLFN